MKEDLNHAVGVVVSLYRSELQTRSDLGRPFAKGHPFANPEARDKLWTSMAELHEEPVGLKMIELRQVLARSYRSGGAVQLAPIFSGYFDQDRKRIARQFEDLGIGFKTIPGVGEREMFLSDLLTQRMSVPLAGGRLHQAKSVLLSELLGSEETVDFVPVSFKNFKQEKGRGSEDDKRFAEILRLSKMSRMISEFSFGDIIRAVLEGRVGLEADSLMI